MDQVRTIQVHPRPTVEEIDSVAQEIMGIPAGAERENRLSQIWYLSMPPSTRNKIWKDPEIRRYFFETELKYLGWVEEDFSVLHIAVTGETPIFDQHT